MSTLQQSIAQRRAVEPAGLSCVSVQAQTPSLLIHTWQGESWVLPWSHFSCARFNVSDGNEQLDLSFANCRVIVIGEQLSALIDDLAAFRVGCLRDLPSEYRQPTTEGAPFISRIDVRPIAEISDGEVLGTPS